MVRVRSKSFHSTTFTFLVILYLSALPTQAKYGGGSGEPNDPYLIYTAEQMNAIGANPNDWDKCFKLMADIDLSEYSGDAFNIIGRCCFESDWIEAQFLIAHPFTGIFDGNGRIISNFSYTSTDASYVGLFGFVGTWGEEAVIKDLGLIDPNVDVEAGSYISPLVGVLKNGTVTNCYVEGGSIVGGDSVGGLVGAYGEEVRGYPDPPFTISNCYSTSSVQGHMRVGGLVGSNYEGRIINSYAMGNVSGKWEVGGLVGHNGSTWHFPPTPGTILNCYSTGLVSGEYHVGGLVGRHVAGTVIGCLWDVETSGQTRSARGAGKATTEMKTSDTFAGWGGCGNKGIWTIDEGNDYPRLWWENKPGIQLEGQLSDFLQGAGTEDEPYLIYTVEQINMIGVFPCKWDKNFKLMADVDLNGFTGMNFNIIGIDWTNPFKGVFDGNGHTISNFSYISKERDRAGLFGCVDDPNAKIRDLGLIDPNVDVGTGSNVGSLVGNLRSGTITGCHVSGGGVSGNEIIGGLVGYSWYGAITNCYSNTSVTGDERIGGLVGLASRKYVGERTEITNCYSVGSVVGNERIGGLVGRNSGIISNCFWDVETSGQTTSDGGIGLTTAELQTVSTFLDAGWDFVDETDNGTEDIWWIDEGQDFPRLWWERDDLFFLVVDDFESYNDIHIEEPESNLIWNTWIDGFDNPEINGSLIGESNPPFVGWSISRTGKESMPYYYNNSGPANYSEATANVTNLMAGRDWTKHGIKTLSLWFRRFMNSDPWFGGRKNDPEPMYVALANMNRPATAVYHDDPNATQIAEWMEWRIDLQEFANQGVDLTNINTISIGFGYKDNPQPGGSGKMHFDDIRLYQPAP